MKTLNKKEQMYQAIEKHGANLNAIFNTGLDNITRGSPYFRIESFCSATPFSGKAQYQTNSMFGH